MRRAACPARRRGGCDAGDDPLAERDGLLADKDPEQANEGDNRRCRLADAEQGAERQQIRLY